MAVAVTVPRPVLGLERARSEPARGQEARIGVHVAGDCGRYRVGDR